MVRTIAHHDGAPSTTASASHAFIPERVFYSYVSTLSTPQLLLAELNPQRLGYAPFQELAFYY